MTEPTRRILDGIAQQLHDDDPAAFHGAGGGTDCPACNPPAVSSPAPADRAAVLREAADALDAYIARYRSPSIANWTGAVTFLRRLADEAPQPETQAQPPRYRWCVETLDPLAGEWAPGTRFLNRAHAVERYQAVSESHPAWNDGGLVQRRLVRETVTYTVEPAAEQLPEAAEGAQQ